MAEGDITFYNEYFYRRERGEIDPDTDAFKVALVGSGYTPDYDADLDFSDISSEIVASGYTAGGEALGSVTVTKDNTNDLANVDAPDVVWTNLATATIAGAIFYKSSATQYLVFYMAITTNSNGNNYSIIWHTDGIWDQKQGV